jgi:protein-tyrosine phosphatase
MPPRRLVSLVLIAVTAGCAYSHANRWKPSDEASGRPTAERIDDERVRLRWPATFADGPVDVFAGLSPDAIDRSRALAQGTNSEIILSNVDSPFIDQKFRLYYQLIPAGGGAPVTVAERRLPLEGPDNFRDLGGYATADGQTVRWNRLYRSNDLSGLTGPDLEYLASIGIKLICDFRSERERNEAPDREFLPAGAPQVHAEYDPPQWLNLTVEQTGLDPQIVREQIQSGTLSAVAMRRVMRRAYRSFVTDYSDQWAELFHKIAGADNLPTVVHCTAGKDRTGFASALILLSLGVPEETVFEDYMLTNQYRRDFYAFVLRWVSLYSFFRTDPDDLIPLLEARPEYLRESLDAIREGYGSVEQYLATALDVTPTMMEQIRKNLLVETVAGDSWRVAGSGSAWRDDRGGAGY